MKAPTFIILVGILIVLDIVVPFVFLKHIDSFYAGCLWWCALSVVGIVAAAVYTKKWKRH